MLFTYDHSLNKNHYNRIESVRYKAALAITGAIKGSSREKLYQEISLEHFRRIPWMR